MTFNFCQICYHENLEYPHSQLYFIQTDLDCWFSTASFALRIRPSPPMRAGVHVLLLNDLDLECDLELDIDLRSSEDDELDLLFSDLFALVWELASLCSDLKWIRFKSRTQGNYCLLISEIFFTADICFSFNT